MKDEGVLACIDSGLDRLSLIEGWSFLGMHFGVLAYALVRIFRPQIIRLDDAYQSVAFFLIMGIVLAVWLCICGRDLLRHLAAYLGFRLCAPRFYWIAMLMLVAGLIVTAGSVVAITLAVPGAIENPLLNPPVAETVERVSASPKVNFDLFFIVLLGPIIEECLFRGVGYQLLANRMQSTRKGILWSAVIFAAGHFSPMGFVGHFAGGLMMAWLFAKSKSIYPSIVLHVLNNGVAAIAMFLLQR